MSHKTPEQRRLATLRVWDKRHRQWLKEANGARTASYWAWALNQTMKQLEDAIETPYNGEKK